MVNKGVVRVWRESIQNNQSTVNYLGTVLQYTILNMPSLTVNKVADLLSRGDVEEAKEVVRSRCGGRCEVRTLDEGFVREIERRVQEATLEEYKGWE